MMARGYWQETAMYCQVEQWEAVKDLLGTIALKTEPRGRPRQDMCAVLNGILWVCRPGLHARTSRIAIRSIRPAIPTSAIGARQGCGTRCSGNRPWT